MNKVPINSAPTRFVETYLLFLLEQASHALSAEFHEHLRRRGVAVTMWRVLASLVGNPGETVTGLAASCLMQQPTMTKLLDRMVRDGMVSRTQDARDRRVVRIDLTARGQKLAAELVDVASRHEAQVLVHHPLVDEAGLKELLRGMIASHTRPRRV